MRRITVEVRGDDTHERTALSYYADEAPKVGEAVTVQGVSVVVENVLNSLNPADDSLFVEARRSDPAE